MITLDTNKDISFKDVLYGTYHNKDMHLTNMDHETRYELGNKYKEFLLATCRKGSNPYYNILHTTMLDCENFGIYERLVYNIERDKVEYIAGQDYPGEIRYIKKLIVKWTTHAKQLHTKQHPLNRIVLQIEWVLFC